MQSVKEYVFSLMVVSVSCAALNILAPEKGNLSKYVHFIAALIVSVVMLSPIQSFFGVLPGLFEGKTSLESSFEGYTEDVYAELVIYESLEIIKKDIANEIEKRFAESPEGVEIEYDAADSENVVIKAITVSFSGVSDFLLSDTENYISELFGCKCYAKEVESD